MDPSVPIMACPFHIAFAIDSFGTLVSTPRFMRLICLLMVGKLSGICSIVEKPLVMNSPD